MGSRIIAQEKAVHQGGLSRAPPPPEFCNILRLHRWPALGWAGFFFSTKRFTPNRSDANASARHGDHFESYMSDSDPPPPRFGSHDAPRLHAYWERRAHHDEDLPLVEEDLVPPLHLGLPQGRSRLNAQAVLGGEGLKSGEVAVRL